MEHQTPSVGRIVHFVNGDQHCAAIITAQESREIMHDAAGDVASITYGQTLYVMPPMEQPFSTVASYDPACASATWHWPERV